jgi:D-lactate dehydrogenase
VRYVPLDELYRESDILSLHVPLTPQTHHLMDAAALAKMKRGVMLINTSRGALVDSRALLAVLKSGHLGAAGLDVYEEEAGIFFQDLSGQVLQDDVLARLLTFHNVLVTSHQAFLTREALANIAETTLGSVRAFERGEPLAHEVRAAQVLRPAPTESATG